MASFSPNGGWAAARNCRPAEPAPAGARHGGASDRNSDVARGATHVVIEANVDDMNGELAATPLPPCSQPARSTVATRS